MTLKDVVVRTRDEEKHRTDEVEVVEDILIERGAVVGHEEADHVDPKKECDDSREEVSPDVALLSVWRRRESEYI